MHQQAPQCVRMRRRSQFIAVLAAAVRRGELAGCASHLTGAIAALATFALHIPHALAVRAIFLLTAALGAGAIRHLFQTHLLLPRSYDRQSSSDLVGAAGGVSGAVTDVAAVAFGSGAPGSVAVGRGSSRLAA